MAERQINARPGTVVCVARWDGEILYDNQGAFYKRIAAGAKGAGRKKPQPGGNPVGARAKSNEPTRV